MACPDNERLLHAYFDGEIDPVRSVEFEKHMETCPACARDLRSQQTIRESLRSADLYQVAPKSLKIKIESALPRETPQPRFASQRRAAFEWLAVAAAIVLAFVMGARITPNVGGQQTNSLAQEIAANHIRSLQPGHLFDVESTDQHTVKPWFDGKLDFAPPVIDLASQGFPLVGGRLDYLNHRDVAALVYQRQKHLINLFVWPAASRPTKLPGVQAIQGYNLVFWWRDGMSFCAVSDLNAVELRQFAQLLER